MPKSAASRIPSGWEVFAAHRPATVFHAAAHKHVPMMEANPGEAIKNNVFGTRNMVADGRPRHGVERFVMVSTDKAVNPTSVMGATKRARRDRTSSRCRSRDRDPHFVTVRFGNVLGSPTAAWSRSSRSRSRRAGRSRSPTPR